MLDITGNRRGNLALEEHETEIADADSQEPAPALATHGFCAIPFAADPPAGELDPAYRRYFSNLCAAAVKKATGANIVIGLPAMVQVRLSGAGDHDGPISVCHADFTPTSAARRSAQALSQLPKPPRQVKRFAAYNVWWLARSGPQDRPLALSDASRVAAADLQTGGAKVIAPDQSQPETEIAFQRYSERHRWFWYPKLGPDRLLLFCGFDSDPSQPSMVAHCAFTNPDCPPGTPPRISVEGRCFAFW